MELLEITEYLLIKVFLHLTVLVTVAIGIDDLTLKMSGGVHKPKMGCDIHMYVEKYSEAEKRWMSADVWEESDYSIHQMDISNHIYSGRNYELFAILANVRNGDNFKPISEPRGVPKDVSWLVKKAVNGMNGDGHSHSYFTLEELVKFDWEGQYADMEGWVDFAGFMTFMEKGMPDNYSGMVGGGGVQHISNEEMKNLIESKGKERVEHKYTLVKWKQSYASCAGEFLTETIPKLYQIRGGRLENNQVRIVFFFDN